MLEINQIHKGDCLELMEEIPDKTINLILCDLPYGVTTRNKWDSVIDLNKLWQQYKRIIKNNGAIILTAQQPFTSKLIVSAMDIFRYALVWDKCKGSDFLNCNRKPLNSHEDILIFYKKLPTYNPQKTKGKPYSRKNLAQSKKSLNYGDYNKRDTFESKDGMRFPQSIIKFSTLNAQFKNSKYLHPTQKPIELFEWLIKSYSNEGDLILDNCIGSGTTAVACKQTNRNFIGIEKEDKYIKIAKKRLSQKSLLPLAQKQEGGNGVPPTAKPVGIPPKIL